MDVDENVSVSKPKTAVKPGQEPEDVSLTHKTPAEIKPTVRIYYAYVCIAHASLLIDVRAVNLKNNVILCRKMRQKLNLKLRNPKLSKKKRLSVHHLRIRNRRYDALHISI